MDKYYFQWFDIICLQLLGISSKWIHFHWHTCQYYCQNTWSIFISRGFKLLQRVLRIRLWNNLQSSFWGAIYNGNGCNWWDGLLFDRKWRFKIGVLEYRVRSYWSQHSLSRGPPIAQTGKQRVRTREGYVARVYRRSLNEPVIFDIESILTNFQGLDSNYFLHAEAIHSHSQYHC